MALRAHNSFKNIGGMPGVFVFQSLFQLNPRGPRAGMIFFKYTEKLPDIKDRDSQ